MSKRVSGNYYIPNLSKGLIDGSSKGRIDDDYKKKCSELTNFWIKNNNNIAKRPPIRPIAGLDNLNHVIDVTQTSDRIVFLRRVDLNVYPDRAQEAGELDGDYAAWLTEQTKLRRELLEDIGWQPGTVTAADTTPRSNGEVAVTISGNTATVNTTFGVSPDDAPDLPVWEFLTAAEKQLFATDPNTRDTFPIVTKIESYDKRTLQVLPNESIYFVYIRPSDRTTTVDYGALGDTRIPGGRTIPGEKQINVGYTNIGLTNLVNNINTPVEMFNALSTVTPQQAVEANRLRDIVEGYTDTLSDSPDFLFIMQGGVVEKAFANTSRFDHPDFDFYLNRPSLNRISPNLFARTFQDVRTFELEQPIFPQVEPPGAIETALDGEAIITSIAGIDALIREGDISFKINRVEELNEEKMQTFAKKPVDIDLNELSIIGKVVPVVETSDSILPNTRISNLAPGTPARPLEDLKEDLPSITELITHLKFSFLVAGTNELSTNTSGYITYIVPDLQITVPSSDVWGAGQYLTKVKHNRTTYNVFAAHGLVNQLAYTDDDQSQFLTTKTTRITGDDDNLEAKNNDPEINKYPNGTGAAVGEYGVYLYLQTGNKIDETTGNPIFYPFATDISNAGKENEQARTDYIVYLTLDQRDSKLQEIMNDMRLISLYASRGKEGFAAVGAVQLGQYITDTYQTDSPAQTTLRRVKITDNKIHVIPWQESEYLESFWVYSASAPLTLPDDTKPGFSEFKDSGAVPDGDDAVKWLTDAILDTSSLSTPGLVAYLLNSNNIRAHKYFPVSATRRRVIQDILAQVDVNAPHMRDLLAIDRYYIHITSRQVPSDNAFDRFFGNTRTVFSYHLNRERNGVHTRIRSHVGNISAEEAVRRHARSAYDNGVAWRASRRSIGVYQSGMEITRSYTNETNTVVPLTISRVPGNINYYHDIGVRYRQELETGLTELSLRPKVTVFNSYYLDSETKIAPVSNRILKTAGPVAAFSEFQSVLTNQKFPKFTQGYLDFLENTITAGRHTGYLRGSNLGPSISVFDRTRSDNEPQTIILTNRDLSDVNVTDFVETGRGGVLFTDKRAYTINGLSGKIRGRVIHESGLTAEVLANESVILGADGDSLKILRYYEEAGGYITDVINGELRLPGNVVGGTALMNKHKIALFHCENTYDSDKNEDTLYTVSIGNRRDVKGFTKFTVPCEITRVIKLSEDKIGILTRDCSMYEMDFNKDFNNEEGKWTDRINGEHKTYEAAFTPLPVLQVYADDFSVLKTTTLRYLVVGCNGHPAFDIQIVDGNTGQITRKTSFRRIRPDTVTIDSDFSGQVAVKNMPQNGSSQPELRISKTDDEYIEFSSVNVQLGG